MDFKYLMQRQMMFQSIVGVESLWALVARETVLAVHLLVLQKFVLEQDLNLTINFLHQKQAKK